MDLDDDDSKVRRNVVVVSAAVLIVAFLKIPLSHGISESLKLHEWSPDGVRLWATVFVVLVYLGLRFRFSDEGQKVVLRTTGQFGSDRAQFANEYLQATFDPRVQRGGALCESWNEICDRFRKEQLTGISPESSYSYEFTGVEVSSLHGRAGLSVVHLNAVGERLSRPGSINVKFELPRGPHAVSTARATFNCLFYSQHAVVRLFPFALLAAALAISGAKAVSAALG